MPIFSQKIKVNYSLGLAQNNKEIKEAIFKTKKMIYKAFAKNLNEEQYELAIFQDNKLVNRGEEFKNYDQSKKYEIYKITEMKQHLDNYKQQIEAQKYKVKDLQRKEEELLNTINQNQLIQQQNIVPQQQQFLISQIITKKERELEDLIIRRQTIFDRNRNESIAYDITSQCIFCQEEIYDEKIQTVCQHDYHYNCFRCLIEAKIDSAPAIICLCNQKLSLKMLHQLNDQAEVFFFQNKIYQNQLIQIQKYAKSKKLNLTSCPAKNCKSLFVIKQNESIKKCPYCIN